MLSVIQPPSTGPTTGATSVVIAHIASAVPALAGGELASSRDRHRGIICPPTAARRTPNRTSHRSAGAEPAEAPGADAGADGAGAKGGADGLDFVEAISESRAGPATWTERPARHGSLESLGSSPADSRPCCRPGLPS